MEMEMESHQAAAGGGDEQQICRIHGCKNVSSDNQLQYCEHHYKFFTSTKNPSSMNSNKRKYLTKKNEEMEMDLLPDEHFCSHTAGIYTSGVYRCKNLRMSHSATDDDHSVPKTSYCEKHYNYYQNRLKKKRRSRHGEDAGTGPIEIRDSNFSKLRKKVMEEHDPSLDVTAIQPSTSGSANVGTKRKNEWSGELDFTDLLIQKPSLINEEDEGGSANVGTKRRKVERTERSGELDFTDLMTENPSLITSNEMKKNKVMEKMKLPPDEQRCSYTTGNTWRCKKYRMSSHGAAADDSVPKTKYKYRYRCKNFRMGYNAADDDVSVPNTKYCEKHYNYYASYNKNYKKKKISGDGEGAGCTTAAGPVEETNCSKPGEKVTEEFHDAEIQKLGLAGHNTSDRIERKMENVERAEKSGEPAESLAGIGETVVELESLEHYKTKCFELSVELEKKKVECTTLQGKLLGVVETKTTFEDAAEYWRKMYSDLESRVLRVEKENSTLRSFFSNLDNLLPRHGKESSILRCTKLRNSEETKSEAWGLQNVVTQSGEKHNSSSQNAETSSGGRKGSHVFELKTKENVHAFGNNEHHDSESDFHYYSAVNISSGSPHLSSGGEKVEEGKGCSDKIPSQHGSSSLDHQKMSRKAFVNLVSDDDNVEILGESEDPDYSTDSEGSLGTLMDMLAMKYRNRNEDKEIKWMSETDMLSSFEEDPELYLKAVCALYRQQICEDEISDKGLFHNSDALRCTTLAKFLMGKDRKNDLNKSVKELEILDSDAVEDCKRLARRYSMQLFSIYINGKDPFFPSSYNCQPWR